MGGTRDIRSFFGGASAPPAKKRRTTSDQTTTAPSVEKDALADEKEAVKAGEVAATDEDVAENAAGNQENDAVLSNTDNATKSSSDEVAVQDGPMEHKLKNLQYNARFLMHASWFAQLESEFARPYFRSLVTFLAGEEAKKKTIYPAPENVFGTLRDCEFDSLKVVILGQDPYHGPHQAHGLSFSVLPGVQTPPSLLNIYKEAVADVKITKPSHGCLSGWCTQGVLMLNTVLTVRRGEPNSHKNQGWEKLTDAIIDRVNKNANNVVFLLWGRPAQAKGALINKTKHLVLTSSHPSPLGATKTNEPFIGSKCFSKTNAYLKKHNKDPIDWNALK